MITLCMWLMFLHGLTVGVAVVLACTSGGWLRWWMVSVAVLAVVNAVTLKADAQGPMPPKWPQPVSAVVEVSNGL